LAVPEKIFISDRPSTNAGAAAAGEKRPASGLLNGSVRSRSIGGGGAAAAAVAAILYGLWGALFGKQKTAKKTKIKETKRTK
jgi:hypothetical protein